MRLPVLALGIIIGSGAHALETLSSTELLAMCRSDSDPQAAVCSGYINGFLDGAFATDPRVAERVLSELRQEESFSERAMRTRLGANIERYGPSYYAGFCIPADMPVEVIIAEIQEAMMHDGGKYQQKNARDYLYELLQSKHPCRNDSMGPSGE